MPSRTKFALTNSFVALLYYLLTLVLNFVSRKVFLDYLGADILGLNTTATNLLQFLNLTELGIGVAVSFSLYKPIAEDDNERINEIISLQGHLYRRIAYIIIAGAIILSFFFPLIFKKITLPLWYAYASFGVLLFSSLLSYFVNYKQVILTASQQQYKITFSYNTCILLKTICQIFVLSEASYPYIWWLILEILFTIIASISLNFTIKKNFPSLKKSTIKFKSLIKKYPELTTKIKQLFFHKIAYFAITQTSPLIIYAFLTLSMVAYYGNYLVVTSGCAMLLTAVFNGSAASVGNLITQGKSSKILNVFNELFCIRFLITATICICFYFLIQPFIRIWIGNIYILNNTVVILITINMYFSLSRGVVDTFLNGYGLFKDIWAPIAEAIINLGGAIIGGYFWGLSGIILGTTASMVIIVFIWKPYFLFKEGIKLPLYNYIKLYACNLFAGFISFICAFFLSKILSTDNIRNFFDFAYTGLAYLLVVGVSMGIIIYFISPGGDSVCSRIFNLIRRNHP